MSNVQHLVTSQLSYLPASKVTSPAGVLSELDVLNAEGTPIGSIEGVVIDAGARRVRYLAVQSPGMLRRRRYLLEADQVAQVEPDGRALRLRINPSQAKVVGLDPRSLREFSDDDLLAVLFGAAAA